MGKRLDHEVDRRGTEVVPQSGLRPDSSRTRHYRSPKPGLHRSTYRADPSESGHPCIEVDSRGVTGRFRSRRGSRCDRPPPRSRRLVALADADAQIPVRDTRLTRQLNLPTECVWSVRESQWMERFRAPHPLTASPRSSEWVSNPAEPLARVTYPPWRRAAPTFRR